MKIAIIGGGWAGMAAAVQLAQSGHEPTVFEAAKTLGGRARALNLSLADTALATADNGQHILIGAYTQCLALMRSVGVSAEQALLRKPLTLPYADGNGLRFPALPAPLDALAGIACARGWTPGQRWALLARAVRWRLQGFTCAPAATVADVCQGLPEPLMQDFIEPLCVSALNLPAAQASGSIFLRVLKDALFAGSGGSHFLVPRVSLGALFPEPAAQWLKAGGHTVHTATRVLALQPQGAQWTLHTSAYAHSSAPACYDGVLLACPPHEAARLVLGMDRNDPSHQRWAQTAQALEHTAIATVYAQTAQRLSAQLPWLALRSSSHHPAQFVFDRGHLHAGDANQQGLMAFVVSDCRSDRETLQTQVLQQAREQLGWSDIRPVQTVIEKRATFACTPGVERPGAELGQGLWACGDYVAGPYPATLEGAVLSGLDAAKSVVNSKQSAADQLGKS
ncbi:hydroxysqualene dehydroxylase HpnE [Comamonas sp.]|uniref:hydroxysqualene dehydroxylase HpnE n=1 Tax=Comamonas sp. TaxID=34028 RepID=UPI003A93AD37